MLTAQRSSSKEELTFKNAKAARRSTSKGAKTQRVGWNGMLWVFVWLAGVAILSLACLQVYREWILAPQKQLTVQASEQHLQQLSDMLNARDAKWQSSLKSLANSRLLIIAIAQQSLSSIDDASDNAPLRVSSSWHQSLQEKFGANVKWRLLISPDELSSGLSDKDSDTSFSFTDQLLINGCFQGQNMPTEIRTHRSTAKNDLISPQNISNTPKNHSSGLVAHRCQKVSMPVSKKMATPSDFNPILFIRFPISSTVLELTQSTPDFGRLHWTQHFSDNESQSLLAYGASHVKSPTVQTTLDNALWKLSFKYGEGFPKPAPNPILLGLIVAVATFLLLSLTFFCLRSARPNARKRARARFQQSMDFEGNLGLIDLATEDVDWVTGGTLEGGQPSSATPPPKSEPAKPKKGRKKLKVLSSSRKSSAIRKSPVDRPTVLAQPAASSKPHLRSVHAGSEKKRGNSIISEKIFRAYDIRGLQSDGVNTELALRLGVWLGQRSQTVYVARDCRLSSPELYLALLNGLASTTSRVETLGKIPTPMLHFAVALDPLLCLERAEIDADSKDVAFDMDSYLKPKAISEKLSAVMITASHNPPEENGFKLLVNGKTPSADQLKALRQELLKITLPENTAKSITKEPDTTLTDLSQRYVEAISQRNTCPESCRVVVDTGNGVTSEIAPILFEEMGCEVIPLNCDFDGRFPNRSPDTSDEKQLQSLVTIVTELKADLGIAFDGDGDRLAVVTAEGKIVKTDELLMLFSRDVLSRNPGRDVIFDVKCSRNLVGIINQCGGRPVMSKTGHSHIQQKMKARNALLGGDFSGHICFADHWIGSDDGLFAAARLLDILDQTQLPLDKLVEALPHSFNTPEIRIDIPEEEKAPLLNQLHHSDAFATGKVTTIDGIRVDFPKSWGLVRASNTSASLTFRFEGSSEAELARVQFYFKQALLKIKPSLELPF